jgi:hypothetical protein
MMFSNFVIDVVLGRNFDDPWRKSTVIDHKIFCSATVFFGRELAQLDVIYHL